MHLQEFYESSENLFQPYLYDRIGRLLLCFCKDKYESKVEFKKTLILQIFQHAYLVIRLVMLYNLVEK